MKRVEIPDMPLFYSGLTKNAVNVKVFQCPECKRLMMVDCTEEVPDLSCSCTVDFLYKMEEVEPYVNYGGER